jgi:flavin reductase (DIM6/NTAB) family NADH-FMN oxidoreductase RutF
MVGQRVEVNTVSRPGVTGRDNQISGYPPSTYADRNVDWAAFPMNTIRTDADSYTHDWTQWRQRREAALTPDERPTLDDAPGRASRHPVTSVARHPSEDPMTLRTESPSTSSVRADPDGLRALLRHQASTVTVLTAPGSPPVGFTATSFTSVSLSPLVVSFCVNLGSSSWPTVARARYVGVHLLAEHQEQLARTFATRGVDRFAVPTRWRPGPEGVPILDDTLAWLVCRVIDRVTVGDHAVVLAEPELLRPAGVGTPLLYHRGRYTALAPAAAPPPRPAAV